MEEQLDLILQETNSRSIGSRHACLLTVHQIILDLYRIRINGKQELSEGKSYSSEWMKDILIYMNEHMDEPLTLTILAQKALVSPAHFSRVFGETTGIGVSRVSKHEKDHQGKGTFTGNESHHCPYCRNVWF
ncbi:AraC family transcriptional regulator [[Brevibacterium] frigoritolerans]|uniref:AraC family transcriptional regulator n=1 Tax=Peribacillus frigoritolerans TaxID=450367 RepID=A0A941J945_9BACI|nr:AraC family transcriptional regulator [Peribacillus frigoritolerans]